MIVEVEDFKFSGRSVSPLVQLGSGDEVDLGSPWQAIGKMPLVPPHCSYGSTTGLGRQL
jgi:hypothetical protein